MAAGMPRGGALTEKISEGRKKSLKKSTPKEGVSKKEEDNEQGRGMSQHTCVQGKGRQEERNNDTCVTPGAERRFRCACAETP